jgi:hypothetical protein
MPITITPASALHRTPVTLVVPSGYLAKATATTCSGKTLPVTVQGLTATAHGARHDFLTWTVADPTQAASVRTVMALTSNQGCPKGPHHIAAAQLPAVKAGGSTHSTTVAAPSHATNTLPVLDTIAAVLVAAVIAAVVFRRVRRRPKGAHR